MDTTDAEVRLQRKMVLLSIGAINAVPIAYNFDNYLGKVRTCNSVDYDLRLQPYSLSTVYIRL